MCPCLQLDLVLTDHPERCSSLMVSAPPGPSFAAPAVSTQQLRPHRAYKKHGQKGSSLMGTASKCRVASLSHTSSGEKSCVDSAAPHLRNIVWSTSPSQAVTCQHCLQLR